jgi:hypothetical protein
MKRTNLLNFFMALNLPNFFLFCKKFLSKLKEKNSYFKKFFLTSFTCLFLGLLFGSLIGTFLDTPRALGFWDGLTISIFVLIMEIITFFYYNSDWFTRVKVLNYGSQLNLFKLGFLLAIFIDAFKVGS